MNKTYTAIALVLVAVILSASAYGAYTVYFANNPSPTPTPTATPTQAPTSAPTTSPTGTSTPHPTATSKPAATAQPTASPTQAPTSVTVTDNAGNTMTIPLPVHTVAALDGGISEILCAMGAQNMIIARCDSCTMPPSLSNVTSVGENDYAPNVEALIEKNPDVIFASSMLPYNPTAYQQLIDAGIPVFIVDSTNPEPTNPSEMTKDELYALPTRVDLTCGLMQNFTKIIGHQEEATEYITWAQNYNKIVKDRIYSLEPDQQVKVFLEWYDNNYRTFTTQTVYQAGGINIAENESAYSSFLSPEFVVEANPSVIIELYNSETHNINDFIAAKNAVMNRAATQDTDAVKYDRVYICDFYAINGVRSVVGYLYWAKWLQPSLFSDIDPGTVNQQLNQKFFGTPIAGTFAYP
ncbi:MAG: ABC transporter substrate-binding protein [Candidatus Bathyarchaeia archaeon]|jgi:iron complex transport system substrate-binding protein